ncbi:MAG: bifunctional phosphoribosylaminoimidazolecarboxamide formyltransferase/IMP cyclohydrolase [Hyphomicrobiales bacterium]
MPAIRRALISVSDKAGLVELARALAGRGIELVSTGGTAKALAAAGITVTDIATVTGFPEILDGRVKTLHPAVHAALLARSDDPAHRDALARHGIARFELVIVNVYPFEETVARGAAWDEAIENIDIGGPAMIRSAAKNHASVTVVVDPADYPTLLEELESSEGEIPDETRRRLAAKAFARTAAYDAAISQWFARHVDETAPPYIAFGGKLMQPLRYGENPHQSAAFYETAERRRGVATARQLQGKALSYNNINDTDAAFECVCEFDPAGAAACVIVKHANPCGAALGGTLLEAYARALACDPMSAYGGIVAFNRSLDGETAREVVKLFTEVIIAPAATAEACEAIASKPNLRLLLTGGPADPSAPGLTVRSVGGGLLVQSRDIGRVDAKNFKIVTARAPSEDELRDLVFAFTVVKHVKSNAIVYAKNGATVGIGAGQMSRVDAARIAAQKAEDAARAQGSPLPLTVGSVAASEAFFPFPDGLLQIRDAGATAVIQPGGSLRDREIIAAADAAGLAMVFTGIRHFRH